MIMFKKYFCVTFIAVFFTVVLPIIQISDLQAATKDIAQPLIYTSETPCRVIHITNRDGLSNSSVTAILQDESGLMWFGTWDGLNVYNGKEFKVFKPDPNNPNSISSNIIRHLVEEDETYLWVATDRGIDRFNRRTRIFEHFFFDEEQVPEVEHSFRIRKDEKGQILVNILNAGTFYFDKEKNQFIPTFKKYLFPADNPPLFADFPPFMAKTTQVLSYWYGSQNILWIGTDMDGIYMLIPNRYPFYSFTRQNIPQMGPHAVRSFMEIDKTLWVGTKGSGIFVFDNTNPEKPIYLKRYTTQNGLLNNAVFVLQKGEGKEVWIGTDGKGIQYYDTRSKKILSLQINANLSNLSSVYSLCFINKNILFAGTGGNGLFMLEIDRSTYPYSVKSHKKYNLPNNIIYSIAVQNDEMLWIGTRGGGLCRLNIKTGRSRSYGKDDILCLFTDENNRIWTGTSTGLNRFVYTNDTLFLEKHFTEADGLPNNTIHGIIRDKEQYLWVSTNSGIAKLSRENSSGVVQIIPYFEREGLQNNEFSDGAYYYCSSKSPYMYFGGISGFTVFDPALISTNSFMPKLALDGFYLDNVQTFLPPNSSLKLQHRNQTATFHFMPVDYIDGDKCELIYMVEGFHRDWIRLGTSRTVVVSSLPSGKYTLKVKNTNAEKILNTAVYQVPITVLPPLWARWWALVGYGILAFAIIFFVRKDLRYKRKTEQNLRDKEQTHQAKLQFFTNIAHEFSNSLTLIDVPNEMLSKRLQDDVFSQKYLNSIRSNSTRMKILIRQLVEFRKADSGLLKMNIQNTEIVELSRFVISYFLETMQQKEIGFEFFPSEKRIFWNVDVDAFRKILFNLISNAVKYTPAGERIEVKLFQENKELVLEVINSGVGIEKDDMQKIFDRFEVLNRLEKKLETSNTEMRSGIGLALCKSLMSMLNGTIYVKSDGETYTSFIARFPVLKISGNDIAETGYIGAYEMDMVKDLQRSAVSTVGGVNAMEDVNIKAAASGEISMPPSEQSEKMMLLIIDDEAQMRDLLKEILSEQYEVMTAENGQSALNIINETEPNLIICDLMMPVMDGIAFTGAVRSKENLRHIPIIILSAQAEIESHKDAIETGADFYLEKPFSPDYLLTAVARLLKNKKNIIEYSESPYAETKKHQGRILHKEDRMFLQKVYKILKNNMSNEDLSPEYVASAIAMSRMQFYRKIKHLTDKTPVDLIRSYRLEQAEKMLVTTQKTVKEIMFACGFGGKAYFYREFMRRFHCSPGGYRRERRGVQISHS
jgi:signal transduction histidine kinase/CheY-like chemotaxis protein/ligand-binding sensor domain-containing protein/AraC-like DNA-binding protein